MSTLITRWEDGDKAVLRCSVDGAKQVRDEVARLARKAQRWGLEEPTIVMEETNVYQGRDTVWLDVKQPNSVIEGWNIHARVLVTEDGPVIERLASDAGDSVEWNSLHEIARSGHCTQCGTKRNRRRLAILQDGDGDFIMVGSDCLADMTGHARIDDIVDISVSAKGLGGLAAWEFAPARANVADYTACALHIFAEQGEYVNAKTARERGGASTHSLVRDLHRQLIKGEWTAVKTDDVADCLNALAKKSGDLCAQVSNTIASGWIDDRHQPLFTWALYSAANTETTSVSQAVGEIKKRATFNVDVTGIDYQDGQWGTVTRVWMNDKHGNRILWRASKDVDMARGKEYTIDASVQAHLEQGDRGILTICNRLKVIA